MITLPPQTTESFVPIGAGLFVSLVIKYILSNPKLDSCCKIVEPEEADSDCDNDDTVKTVSSDNLSKASGNTTATLPVPHPIHTHYYYVQHY